MVSFADVLGSGPEHHEGVRRERLASLDQATPEVQRRKKKKKITKLQRQSTLIRREVESLPTFWPVFIILLSIGQVSQSLSLSQNSQEYNIRDTRRKEGILLCVAWCKHP